MTAISPTVTFGMDIYSHTSFTFGQVKRSLSKWVTNPSNQQVVENIAHFILRNYSILKTPLQTDMTSVDLIASDPNRPGRGRSFIYDRTLDLFLVLLNKTSQGDTEIGSGSNKKLTFALDPIRDQIYASAGIIPYIEDGIINTEQTTALTQDECQGYELTKGLHGFLQLVTKVSYTSKKHGYKTRFITEFINGGTLNQNLGSLNDEQKWQITNSLLRSLKELHQKKLIHRDFKPSNIVLQKKEGNILPVICDMGSVCSIYDKNRTSACYTSSWWISPELARAYTFGYPLSNLYMMKQFETYSTAALDMWQLGLILFQLWLNDTPPWFLDVDASTVYKEQCNNDLYFRSHPILSISRSPIHNLISNLLSNDPKLRLSATAAIDFLNGRIPTKGGG